MATKKAELKASISLNRSAFTRGLAAAGADAASWARGVAASTGQTLASIGKIGIGGGLAAGVAGIGGLGLAISKAANLETITTQFETLLGSAKAAKDRIGELVQFAAKTPFELPEITAASKMLEVMAGKTLSTGKGLTMVGDVAAASGASFEEAARAIGRLYSNLQSNRPAGEALQRLQEIGAISGDLRGKIEKLVEAGNGKMAWDAAAAGLARFSGGMDKLSKNFIGMMSTLRDGISALMVAVGTPVMDALKPIILGATQTVEAMTKGAGQFGEKIAAGIKAGVDLFTSGKLGEFLKQSLIAGVATAGNYALGVGTSVTEFLARGLTTSTADAAIALAQAAVAFGMLFTAGIQRGIGGIQTQIHDWAGKRQEEIVNAAPLPFKPMAWLSSQALTPLKNATSSGIFGNQNPMNQSADALEELAGGMLSKSTEKLAAAINTTADNLSKTNANFKASTALSYIADPAQNKANMILEQATSGLPSKRGGGKKLLPDLFGESGAAPKTSEALEQIKASAAAIQDQLMKSLGMTPAT